jgi:hypothetical protein
LTLSRYRQARSNVFLHRVLGVRQGAEHAVTVDKQFAAMTLDIATELVEARCSSLDGHGSLFHRNANTHAPRGHA